MKQIIFLLCIAATIAFPSCKKDNKNFDNHSSPLMMAMHKMSDNMAKMTMTMDPDHDFAMMMKEHHMGAIEMADYELLNGTDATIKNMAQMMKDAQSKEIATLDSFMMVHAPSGHSQPFMDASQMAMKKMDSDADAQKLNGGADHDFVHLMIVHHQSALMMADAELQYGQVPFMKNMAQMMKDDQTKEISDLQAWLNSGKD